MKDLEITGPPPNENVSKNRSSDRPTDHQAGGEPSTRWPIAATSRPWCYCLLRLFRVFGYRPYTNDLLFVGNARLYCTLAASRLISIAAAQSLSVRLLLDPIVQHHVVLHACGGQARALVPVAAVRPRPLQHFKVPAVRTRCAEWHVLSSQSQPRSRAHWSTARCPLPAALWQTTALQGVYNIDTDFSKYRYRDL